MSHIVTVQFEPGSDTAQVPENEKIWQYDYGQKMEIHGLNLPHTVAVEFTTDYTSPTEDRIGVTEDGITTVPIPDSVLERSGDMRAYVRVMDADSGRTEYVIKGHVEHRERPSKQYEGEEPDNIMGKVLEALETALDEAEVIVDRAEGFVQSAEDSATEAKEAVKGFDTRVEQAKTAIGTQETASTKAVQAEGAIQTKAVADAGAEAVQKVEEAAGNLSQLAIRCEAYADLIKVTDSSDLAMESLSLFGKTTQVKTTGANIFDQNVLLDVNSPNYDKTNAGSGLWFYKVPASEVVIVSTKIINKQGQYLYAGDSPSTSGKGAWISHKTAANKNYATITPIDGNIYLGVNNTLASIELMLANTGGIMINTGTTAKPFEPYTGGKPSPSLEYPQEIVHAGEDGKITVDVLTNCIFDGKKYAEKQSISYIQPLNNGFQLTQAYGTSWDNVPEITFLESGKTYTILSDTPCTVDFRNSVDFTTSIFRNSKNAKKHTFVSNYTGSVKLKIDNEALKYPFVVNNLMFCYGDASEIEPYKHQSITIPTPNGLPGIPVKSGGNYTDESGQQWVTDEIDLERGKYIKRIWSKVFAGADDEKWVLYENQQYNGFKSGFILPEIMDKREGFCNLQEVILYGDTKIKNGLWIGAEGKVIFSVVNPLFDASLSDKGLSNWKAYLAENPMEVVTYLTTPTETDLSPELVEAYKKLHTNKPTTVVQNNGGAGMKLGYVADTKNYIDNKLAALMVNTRLEQDVREIRTVQNLMLTGQEDPETENPDATTENPDATT